VRAVARPERTGRAPRVDGELLEEQLEPVAALNVVDKDDCLARQQPHFENKVQQKELVFLGAPHKVLLELAGVVGRVCKLKNDLPMTARRRPAIAVRSR